jgi:Domain of unknown function (DUF1843)
MAQPSGGQVKPYGVAISDALNDPSTTLEQMASLRDEAQRLLDEQGDLSGALERLDAEITRRKQ